MTLEQALKYFFAKTSTISDSPRATASDRLTGTDVMAAMGMVQSIAPMGFSAFMGKVGVSNNDAERAVLLLTEYALQACDKVAALRKLESDVKPAVMQTLATYAYMDYCRTASSKKPCDCCGGEGFIEAEVFSTKYHMPYPEREFVKASVRMGVEGFKPSAYEVGRDLREKVKVICKLCNGKGVLPTACRDCNGRGRAVNRKRTEEQGVPVMGSCKQCSGRGYERIPSTDAYRAISSITDTITLDTWKKTVKPFYDGLTMKLEIEESWANTALNKVTR
ncbi:Antitermination protein [Serratia entomophila]|uniref:antitermination protein n=1 Tax=Serratia entomophila TaxID=42906 RepID=UPI00217C5818|nr:antitermination protein [Serratia entomophila]CAI1925096.1 Antitermination protein [Serratia entomophila]